MALACTAITANAVLPPALVTQANQLMAWMVNGTGRGQVCSPANQEEVKKKKKEEKRRRKIRRRRRKELLFIYFEFISNFHSFFQTYDKLATFVDAIGNRVCGSPALVAAEDYMLQALQADGLENVHGWTPEHRAVVLAYSFLRDAGENVMIPKWVRGAESASLLKPRVHPMSILGLGTSVGTPASGITASALVVTSFDDLTQQAALNNTKG